jgi:hypothetical protein
MTDEFVDAVDWEELKKENNEALQEIKSGRYQERSELDNEKGRVWWEQEEERRQLHWEWSQLNEAKSRFQAEIFQFEDQKKETQEIDEENSRQDWEWRKFQDERRHFEKRKEDHASSSQMFREIKGLKRRFDEKDRRSSSSQERRG